MKELNLESLFFNTLAITAALLTIHGFITSTELKLISIPVA